MTNYLCQGVCFLQRLFVCLLAGLLENYSADFHKIYWKGGILAMEEEEPLDFGGNLYRFTLGLW